MRRAAVALLAGAAVLTGCSAVLTGCSAPIADAAPEGVSVVVYQPRTVIATGRFAIQVVNESADELRVTGARLESPDFAAPAAWERDSTIVHPGLALDLTAALPAIDCTASPDAVAVIDYELAGRTGTARIVPDDPFGLLPRIHDEACLADMVAEIALITPTEVVVAGAQDPAVLVLSIAPTGAAGSVTIDSVQGTPLLSPVVDGMGAPEAGLGIRIDASGPSELRIPFVPNRCDAHALAEDKVGTVIPFSVTTADVAEGRLVFTLPGEMRDAFYDFFTGYCGFPDV